MDLLRAFIGAGFEKDLFNKEQIAVSICKEVIDYYKEHGKYPLLKSKDKRVRILAAWLNRQRTLKEGKCRGTIYQILQEMAGESGLPNMFNSNWKDDFN